MQPEKNILILTNGHEEGWLETQSSQMAKDLRKFVDTLNAAQENTFAVASLDQLEFSIENGHVRIFDSYNSRDLASYDMIHFRNVMFFEDYGRAIAHYMIHHNKKVFEEVDVNLPEHGKISQMVLFALNDIRVPDTWACWNIARLVELLNKKSVEYPFILKANDGIKGANNYLVQNRDQLLEIVHNSPQIHFVAQSYIPNDGDYRVLCFGKEEPLLFKRTAVTGSHLNNTAQDAVIEEISISHFSTEVIQMAVTSAQLTNRIFAGVDVIRDKQKDEWMILEVNTTPALYSGVLLDKKRDKYLSMIGEII